ncbi:dihydrodipicolinate reductase [Rhodobacter sp. NTK016B]|uniref:dihydrodipicolinate reductase n=1 Tax=Rhodobacter sp. NTK016B TaxID=2759676 RepID=UPI001A8F45FF|nr:dihydrodipicolinate reductase [Rhodobacter sp. NTK016B]MBN8292007.1 dihydrodipicolinate reductase [Rhodobacter sp. NTK016B]
MTRILAVFLGVFPSAVLAFEPLTDGSEFRRLVFGNDLTRLGVRLQVRADGRITGSGLGQPVYGEWEWRDGYFCRTLFWDGDDLGADCQLVLRDGDRLRFVTERGAGIGASFRIR